MGNILIDGNGNALILSNKALEVTSAIDSNIVPGNIKKDVSILGVTGTYEGSGGSSIISFTINNVSYQSDSGMEWYDWVSSSYNTGGFICDRYDTDTSNYIRASTGHTISYKNVSVRPWDIIAQGRAYLHSTGGGSND